MIIEIESDGLMRLLFKQIDSYFCLDQNEMGVIKDCFDEVLRRCEYCFSFCSNKYYKKNNAVYFNPYHSGQYSIFLYYLSNTIFRTDGQRKILADKVYYLNKALNGLDLFYEVHLPDIFSLDHPVGSVIGRAEYSNYFSFSQNCTVGNNKGIYPKIGTNVSMKSGAKIIGKSCIGDNVIVAANAYIKDQNVPSMSIVFGSSPNLIIKENKSR